uniref:CCHC-type domain-containing protein n=1 Tax=Strongyloides venezuelensis TaxID=75913 RepID=A0A0K0F1C7_STRVS
MLISATEVDKERIRQLYTVLRTLDLWINEDKAIRLALDTLPFYTSNLGHLRDKCAQIIVLSANQAKLTRNIEKKGGSLTVGDQSNISIFEELPNAFLDNSTVLEEEEFQQPKSSERVEMMATYDLSLYKTSLVYNGESSFINFYKQFKDAMEFAADDEKGKFTQRAVENCGIKCPDDLVNFLKKSKKRDGRQDKITEARTCYSCNKVGHVKAECEKVKPRMIR